MTDIRSRHVGEHWCDGDVGRAIYDPGTPCDAIREADEKDAAIAECLKVRDHAARERDRADAAEAALAEMADHAIEPLTAYVRTQRDAAIARAQKAEAALAEAEERWLARIDDATSEVQDGYIAEREARLKAEAALADYLASAWPLGAELVAARADAKALAEAGTELAHLALGLKTGRDLDRAIGEWEKAIAAHKEASK